MTMENVFQRIEDGLVLCSLCLRAWRRVLRMTSVNSNAGKGSLEFGLSKFFSIHFLLLWLLYECDDTAFSPRIQIHSQLSYNEPYLVRHKRL